MKRKIVYLLFCIFSILILLKYLTASGHISNTEIRISPHPYGKNFAFTVTDDPDGNKFKKVKLVYDFLLQEGFKTTAAVWVKNADKSNGWPERPVTNYSYGDTTENKEYLEYFRFLQKNGFEIATHTISAGNDYRKDTLDGYETFKKHFGKYPNMVIMHSKNLENLYWGKDIFTNRFMKFFAGLLATNPYSGHIETSKYFWGDFAKDHIKYVRMWGTPSINTLAFDPYMPYHPEGKRYVNYHFSFSDGFNSKIFNKLLSDANLAKLKTERGIAIVYTHFADGFVQNSTLNPLFKRQMMKISRDRSAWLAPASTILDRLLLLRNITINRIDDTYLISNCNPERVTGLTLLVPQKSLYFSAFGKSISPNSDSEIILGDIEPFQTYVLYNGQPILQKNLTSILPKTVTSYSMKSSVLLPKNPRFQDIVAYDLDNAYIIANSSRHAISDVTLFLDKTEPLFTPDGTEIPVKETGETSIGDLKAFQVYLLYKSKSKTLQFNDIPFIQKVKFFLGRSMVFLQDGNFLKLKYWSR